MIPTYDNKRKSIWNRWRKSDGNRSSLAAEIRRTRQIGDFSRWKDHDAYQQAFERLLRDLKAEGKHKKNECKAGH